MSARAWLARPVGDRGRRVAFTLVSVALIAAALLLALKTPGTPRAGERPTPRGDTPAGQAAPRDPDLQPARSLARRFLRGYLAFVDGHEPVSAVSDAAPGILSALANHHRVPPALAQSHPQIIALTAAPTGDASNVAVTARVRDGEVLTYPIRLLLTRSQGGRLVVARVGEG